MLNTFLATAIILAQTIVGLNTTQPKPIMPINYNIKNVVTTNTKPITKASTIQNIVSLGDSNTQGLYNSPIVPNLDQSLTYPNLLGAKNEGVSGNTIQQVINRLHIDLYSNYIDGADNIVTVLIGVNDFIQGHTLDQAYTDFQTLIQDIYSHGWKIFVLTYLSLNYTTLVHDEIIQFDNRIRNDRNNYFVIDIYYTLLSCLDCFNVDNLHFNSKAHQIIANTIKNYISFENYPVNTF
jgi:lysophospholipase L1-like esterase